MTDFAIDVRGLSKSFGEKQAVKSVDIQMPKGQVWGFLGPNGSGKTTTIRMICGLLVPSAGEGTCLGYDILNDGEMIRRKTGYMTQKFSFWTDLTIRENLEFVARIYEMDDRKALVDRTLEQLGLTQRQNQAAEALSGGWKQRLALAAVTMHDPKLLLLDEPTAGVDPQARRDFWDEIHRLSNAGLTVLVSTHYMDEAERCDRIVYLAHGSVIARGRVANIIERAGIKTLRIEGEGARSLQPLLKGKPGVEHAAYFGAALHLSGQDADALERAVQSVARDDISWDFVEPNLEDAFIALMARAGVDERDYE